MPKDQASFDREYATAGEVRRALSVLMPTLSRFWELPLQDYAHAVYDKVVRGTCSTREDALLRLRKMVWRTALKAGNSRYDADQVSCQLEDLPVIQTGPHCHLLIEPDTFYTHLFSALGLTAHARRWHICYSSSTVKFIEKSKKGPGWIWLSDEAVNVFGLTRSRMDPYSICGLNGPYRLSFVSKRGGEESADVARLKSILPDEAFSSAADAIKAANQVLWRRSFPPSLDLLQFDDIDVADLVADHLEDPTSWLSSHLMSGTPFVETILRELNKLNFGPWSGWIRQTTDFFWGLEEGRLLPLHFSQGILSAGSSRAFDVQFNPTSIAIALRQRKLVPNLLINFLVTSILPGVRFLGGCRQAVYYPLMRHLVAMALESSREWQLIGAMAVDESPGMWGHRVLCPPDSYPLLEIADKGEAMQLAAKFATSSLRDNTGEMSSFTGDPIWRELSASLKDGRIHPGSPEWHWA